MGGRRRSNLVENLIESLARFPWWAGVAIAIAGYLGLHGLAVSRSSPGDIGGALIRGLATAGQYIVPLIGLAGALISLLRRKRREEIVDRVTQSESQDAVTGMSWREFEILVAEGFRLQGFDVVETGGGGADGGVDMVLSRTSTNGREKYLVQCKQWRAYKVGVGVVRELYGVMAARGAAGGFVVTSGRFTEEAVEFAQGRNVRLVDGPKLHGLFQQLGRERTSASAAADIRTVAPTTTASPMCPACGAEMVLRTSRRGPRSGGKFWGCARFPSCRGTRPVD